MPRKPRDKTAYRAHRLRSGIVHAFPVSGIPEMSVLLGDLALAPQSEASYQFLWPSTNDARPPTVTIRFVPRERFPDFIDCTPRAAPVPANFHRYPQIRHASAVKRERIAPSAKRPGQLAENWVRFLNLQSRAGLPAEVPVQRTTLSFKTGAAEGVYVLRVDCGEQPAEPHEGAPLARHVDYVFIYCKERTTFSDDDTEVSSQIADGVNLCPKNGWIWFVHPIYFCEQLLRIRLPQDVKQDIAYCKDLPDDLPAPDGALVQLQWGRRLAGMGRICLSVDGEVDECIETAGMAVQTPEPVILNRLLRERDR